MFAHFNSILKIFSPAFYRIDGNVMCGLNVNSIQERAFLCFDSYEIGPSLLHVTHKIVFRSQPFFVVVNENHLKGRKALELAENSHACNSTSN